jgi:hypothetical protein
MVPLTITLSASTPGMKFEGDVSRKSSLAVTGIELKTRRSDNVIAVSILLMILMIGLAVSLLSIVITALTTGARTGFMPLTISISLIFGLPALRNVQPGVPPVGALGDYVAFIWAEICVGVCAIMIAWMWILRSRKDPQAGNHG